MKINVESLREKSKNAKSSYRVCEIDLEILLKETKREKWQNRFEILEFVKLIWEFMKKHFSLTKFKMANKVKSPEVMVYLFWLKSLRLNKKSQQKI